MCKLHHHISIAQAYSKLKKIILLSIMRLTKIYPMLIKKCDEISQNALLLRKISSWELVLYRHTVFSNENRRDFMCFCYHVQNFLYILNQMPEQIKNIWMREKIVRFMGHFQQCQQGGCNVCLQSKKFARSKHRTSLRQCLHILHYFEGNSIRRLKGCPYMQSIF